MKLPAQGYIIFLYQMMPLFIMEYRNSQAMCHVDKQERTMKIRITILFIVLAMTGIGIGFFTFNRATENGLSDEANNAVRFKNALGWMILMDDGDLLTPKNDTEPQDNVLWVNRKNGGLEFVQSGPQKKGHVYMTVLPNRRIRLASAPDELCGWWRTIDEQGLPTIPAPGMRVYAPVPGALADKTNDFVIIKHSNGGSTVTGSSTMKPRRGPFYYFDDDGNLKMRQDM